MRDTLAAKTSSAQSAKQDLPAALREIARALEKPPAPARIPDIEPTTGPASRVKNQTPRATPEELYEAYRSLVVKSGHTWRPGPNEINLVGLRGFTLDGGSHPNLSRQADDTFAIVWRDSEGSFQIKEFEATLEPTHRDPVDVPDADRDGKADAATIRPGQYHVKVGSFRAVPGSLDLEGKVPVYRDTDHDGNISKEEKRNSRRRRDTASEMKIHWFEDLYPNVAADPGSLGCTVLPLGKQEWDEKIAPIIRSNRGRMLYTIIDLSS